MTSNRLIAIAVAMLCSALVVAAPAAPPVQAQTPDPALTLAKSGPTSVLAGDSAVYTMMAANDADTALYNLTFRDVLPLGVFYGGTTTPEVAGDPDIISTDVEIEPGIFVEQQTLVWSNVADVQPNDDFTLTFDVIFNDGFTLVNGAVPDANLPVYAVGSVVNNVGDAYASSNPRIVPRFGSDVELLPPSGGIPGFAFDVATDASAPTELTAIEVTKSEPSPEGELLRGVHDNPTIYTLSVDITDLAPVTDVTVVDYLPANLEFLGCGGVDNTTSGEEYPGSGPLGGASGGPNCLTPASVETISDDGTITGNPGIYTKVTWQIPAGGETPNDRLEAGVNTPYVITYAAAIPMFENTLDFTDAPGGNVLPTPTPGSGGQGSNLDNNRGDSTREGPSESAAINTVVASGTYDGPVDDSIPATPITVESTDRLSRAVEDVRMRKSANSGDFVPGGQRIFTITVETSEYVDASGIELADTMPNGLCPRDDVQNYVPGGLDEAICGPANNVGPSLEITPVTGPSITTPFGYASVSQVSASNGGFDITFDAIPGLGAGEVATITYQAGLRTSYGGGLAGTPPVSGDSFTNTADLTATTDPIPDSRETGTVEVNDSSSAGLATDGLSIDKKIRPRPVGIPPGAGCPTDAASYVEAADVLPERLVFRLGDEVCFRLEVDFPGTIDTRDADVGDFLPVGVEYIDGSMVPADGNTVPPAQFGFSVADPKGPLVWEPGLFDAGLGARFVQPGQDLVVVFAGRVTDIPDSNSPEIKGNLMKMRTIDTAGQANSYRDQVPFAIAPAPPVSITKGVQEITEPPFVTTAADVDDREVREGSVVTFRLDVTNDGRAATANGFSVRNVDVWDVLPAGITCAQISDITDLEGTIDNAAGTEGGGTYSSCTDPGDSTHPSFVGNATLSAIRWVFPIDPGDSDRWEIPDADADVPNVRTLTFDMLIPSLSAITSEYVNNSYVRSFDGFTNVLDDTASYFPADNVDTTVQPEQENAPAAADASNVFLPSAVVGKTAASSITEENNDDPAGPRPQAVPGEVVTYTYAVDVPSRTTVFNGVLSDPLPSQLELVDSPGPVGNFYPDAAATDPADAEALPAGFSGPDASGTLTFPSTYTNTSASTERFEVVLTARVKPGQTAPETVDNTASFDSTLANGTTAVVIPDATASIDVVQPTPSISKSNDAPGGFAVAGDIVTFTLTATTGADDPPVHDAVIVDCIPAGLSFVTGGDAPTTGPAPSSGTDGCDTAGLQRISYTVGTIAPGATVARSYTAEVDATAVGNDIYTNRARLISSTLNDGLNDAADERVLTNDTNSQVEVPGASVTEKTVTPPSARIGERVEFTVELALPEETNFFQLALIDRLPSGLVDPQLSSCEITGGTTPIDCSSAPILGPTPDPGASVTALGFYFGDVTASENVRTAVVKYTVRVADIVGNVDGTRLTNTAQPFWNRTAKDPAPDSPLDDWDEAGDSDDATVTVIEPELTVTKTASDTTPEPGQEFTYTITATNDGTSEAFNATIVDTIPAGIVLVERAVDGGPDAPVSPDPTAVVSADKKTVTWAIGDVAVGATVTLTSRAVLADSSLISGATAVADFTNTARATTYQSLDSDPNGRDYIGTPVTEVVTAQFPVLTTSKRRVTANPAYIGSPITWEIVTRNTGGGTATEVTVSDVLPPNWDFTDVVAASSSPGISTPTITPNPSGDTLVWSNVGQLATGQAITIRFRATPSVDVVTSPGVGSSILHVNRTTSVAKDTSGADGNAAGPYRATASANARIDRVDLAIDKSHATDPVAGENFSWSIVVTNDGPDQAVGNAANPFTVVEELPTSPAGVAFVSAQGTGWTCVPAAAPAPLDDRVSCTRTGNLSAGASFPAITITVAIPSDTPDGTEISNTASVGGQRTYEASDLDDPILDDNTDTDAATIITRANLRIVKSLVNPPGLVAGTNSSYDLAISNLGPSTSRATVAQPIVVSDTLPSTVSFVSATDIGATPTFTCTHDGAATGGVVTCDRTTDMPLGAASSIRIAVAVPSGLTGSLANTGTVTPSITTDPTPGNNTSTIINPIVERADLGITKTALGPSVPGEPTTYRLSVVNNGPGDATVRIQDTLPAGLTYRSSSNVSGNWTCAASTAPDPVPGFRCDLDGKLAFTPSPLNVVTVDVVVDTAASVTGTVVNTAVVSTTAQDTNPDNDIATAPLTFVGVADLALTKVSSGTALPGGPITWTINVANLGPSDSQGPIVVRDQLPDGVIAPASATGTGWSCITSAALLVECTRAAALAAGANSDITLVAVADPTDGTPNPIVNSATVFPTTLESNVPGDSKTANNTDSDPVALAEPDVALAKSVSNATPQPGDQFTYTMTLTNAADAAPAFNMQVSDTLPTGISFVSSPTGDLTSSGDNCATGSEGTVDWTVAGPLAPGASATVSFVAELCTSGSIDRTPITNTAMLDSFESLASGGRVYPGNSDDAVVRPRFPSLAVRKEAVSVNPTYINAEFTWQITVTNTGDGDAKTVDVQDLLPPNWEYVDGSTVITSPSGVANPEPAQSTGPGGEVTLTWQAGSLASTQVLTVAFRGRPLPEVVDDPAVGSDQPHTNTAFSSATDNADQDSNADGSYAVGPVTAEAFIDAADLEVQKLNAATPAIAGTDYSWTVKVRNLGDDPAVGPFTVVDTLPGITPALTFVSATGDGWNCSEASGVVTCTRGGSLPAPTFEDDPAATFPDITVTVGIPSDYRSVDGLTNTATVTARTYDPDVDNNTATAVTLVGGLADLAIAKRHTDVTVTAGSPITYELVVTNNGPSTSRSSITVVDTLPANTTLVDASSTGAGDAWNCVNGTPAAGRVTCTLTGDIPITAPADPIEITVLLGSNASPTVDVVNNAEVISGATPEGAADPGDPDDPKIANNFASDVVRPTTSADLVMDKRSVGALVPGTRGVYRLRVDNAGPSDANAPTIIDTLPPGLTFAGYRNDPAGVVGTPAPGVWTCGATSADLRSFQCTLDRTLVTPGFSVVDIDVDVEAGLTGAIINTSTVSSMTPDPIVGNNTDSDDSTFTTLADLAIVKTGPTAPVVAGEFFDWTLTVTNNGPSVSRSPIRVFDALPDGVRLVTDVTTIAAPWSCTSADGTIDGVSTDIICTLAGDLAAPPVGTDPPSNVAPPLTFRVQALADAGPATITNRSAVQGTTNEPVDAPDNNTSDHDVTLIDRADLQLVKTPETQTVTAGRDATFALAVTNNGSSTADDVIVRDPLPAGMTIALPFAATGWDCSLSTTVVVDCRRATLDPGAAEPIAVVATVAASVAPSPPVLTNVAAVVSSTRDDDPDNNDDDAIVTVVTDADLAITKTHPATPDPVLAGTTVEFEMIVSNAGPSDAAAPVVVTDTLPNGFTYLSVRGPWSCAPTVADAQVIECTKLGGGLAAGATADPLYLLAQTDPTLDASAASDTYQNVARVDSPTPDSNPANDEARDDINIGNQADLSIVKSHDADVVRIGENLVFTLAVSNDGPSEARGVNVTDTLPDGLTLVSAGGAIDPSAWDCAATSGQTVDCSLTGPLPVETDAEDILVTALVEPQAFPTISNTAVVASATAEPDPDPNPNSSTDVVDVPRLVDLYVTKTHTEPVLVGQAIVYTLTVGNRGPIGDDAVITVTDPIPLGLQVTTAISDIADCSIGGALVTCTKDDGLAVDETFTVTITADVLAGAYPSVTNTAEVSSPTDDVDPSNNTSSDPAVVPPLVDLAVTKTHAEPVQVGGQITYTVRVRNNGPTSDPGPVRMLDTLPGSLTPVSARADGMTCDITGQTVACQALAPLDVDAELMITIVADVGAAAYPSVSNTAIVTTPGCSVGPAATADTACPDTDLTNNEATDIATVAPLVRLGVEKSLASQEGLTATWNIVVTNLGSNSTVEPIRMTDILPATLVYVSAGGEGWVCDNFGQTVRCTYSATIAPGASAPPIRVVTLVNAPTGTPITNVATVDGGGPGVPEVTDSGSVTAPATPPLPSTGGGPGILLQWAPLMVLAGLAMVIIANRRRQFPLAT